MDKSIGRKEVVYTYRAIRHKLKEVGNILIDFLFRRKGMPGPLMVISVF
ncbi:hypothetical protein [Sphingobacterium tabacisoli]|uniref:Uncharacterized protein n=1 Tax=Sphingobacterium tabacisoli TaxID=2044855 RepID=A0ABW5L8R7_9SPHI|nr:hypothetical protein [Sphingobacterium tabacisoli]